MPLLITLINTHTFLFIVISKVINKSNLNNCKDFTYNNFTYNINKCDLHIRLLFSAISTVIYKSNLNSYKHFTNNINKCDITYTFFIVISIFI